MVPYDWGSMTESERNENSDSLSNLISVLRRAPTILHRYHSAYHHFPDQVLPFFKILHHSAQRCCTKFGHLIRHAMSTVTDLLRFLSPPSNVPSCPKQLFRSL